MQRSCALAAMAALLWCAAPALGQSVLFDFEDGTDQGFGNSFGNDAGEEFPIVDIGGSNRMEVLRDGDFQEAERNASDNPFLGAINAAVANPGVSTISYDWYVDTSLSPSNYGTFLQIGTYINSGQGAFPYVEDFPGAGKDVELDEAALTSGSVLSGTVTETITAKYGDVSDPDFQNSPSYRFGLILNGDGADATVYFDNIRISGIPEPASIALLGLALPAMGMRRRRR